MSDCRIRSIGTSVWVLLPDMYTLFRGLAVFYLFTNMERGLLTPYLRTPWSGDVILAVSQLYGEEDSWLSE